MIHGSGISAWQATGPRRSPDPLDADTTADVAIVGGGLTGLSVAHQLLTCSPDLDVVVLEGSTVGAGASGRSTGMVGPGVGGSIVALRRRFGDATARAMFQATRDAVDTVVELVDRLGIDCGFEPGQQLVVAETAAQARSLRRQASAFAELGFDVPFLGTTQLGEVLGGAGYRAAIRHPRTATLDPQRLCDGLRAAGEDLGVRVHEQTTVSGVVPGRPMIVATSRGPKVRARIVVLATDGLTGRLGLLAGVVVPLVAHVIRTAPLGVGPLGALRWPPGTAVIESRNFFDYYRLAPDGGVVFGGGRVTIDQPGTGRSERHARATWRRLHRELVARLPDVAGIEITDRWSGMTGFTLDRLPIVGPSAHAPDLWIAGAWCGHGLGLSVAEGAALGRTIGASLAHPAASRDTWAAPGLPWRRSSAPRLPFATASTAALRPYLAGLDIVDRAAMLVDRLLAPGRSIASPHGRPVQSVSGPCGGSSVGSSARTS
jgi:gamma-glutamylputrescine oxidase